MGAGDWLIATGQVKERYAKEPIPVLVVDVRGRPQWHEVFEHNPKIIREPRGKRHQRLVNGSGSRPYIAAKARDRWTWKAFQPTPGEIVFTQDELEFAEPYRGKVFIEPNVKDIGHTNKEWFFDRWQALVDMQLAPMLQCGAEGSRFLDGVESVITPTFRHACAVMSVCRAFVGTEGGMMHAAAAVGVRGVVVFGGFISPKVTGYAMHRNLYTGGIELGCGWRIDCQHCRTAMDRITVEDVANNLKEIL